MLRAKLLFILLFTSILCIFAQDEYVKHIENINSQILYKTFIITEGNKTIFIQDVNTLKSEVITKLYFDAENKCRKFIKQISYPESNLLTIAYYDELGNLASILYCEEQPEGYSYNIVASLYQTEYFSGVKYDYKIKYDFYPEFSDNHIFGFTNSYPETIGEWNMTNYLCVDSLFRFLNISTLNINIGKYKRVKFIAPLAGATSFIKANNINLQDRPGKLYEILAILNVGVPVRIKEYKEGGWCYIEYGQQYGYIHIENLESVEEVIE
jgi:hypothetical protein